MRICSVRGAVFVMLLALFAGFIVYRFILYNSFEAKHSRWVNEVERLYRADSVAIDSLLKLSWKGPSDDDCFNGTYDTLTLKANLDWKKNNPSDYNDGLYNGYAVSFRSDCIDMSSLYIEKNGLYDRKASAARSRKVIDSLLSVNPDCVIFSDPDSALIRVAISTYQFLHNCHKKKFEFSNGLMKEIEPIRLHRDSLNLLKKLGYDCEKMRRYFNGKRSERIPLVCR